MVFDTILLRHTTYFNFFFLSVLVVSSVGKRDRHRAYNLNFLLKILLTSHNNDASIVLYRKYGQLPASIYVRSFHIPITNTVST